MTEENQQINKLVKRFTPKLFMLTFLLYVGVFLTASSFLNLDMSYYLIRQYGFAAVGIAVSMISFLYIIEELRQRKLLRESRFVDVDSRSRSISENELLFSLMEEVKELKNSSSSNSDFEKFEDLIEKQIAFHQEPKNENETFISYFNQIRKVIEQKANSADEKASILLDKGTSYTKWGIWFFIVSIAIWQILAVIYGFQVQFIYGMVSCSILFVFIEFLSAWFLRQYRHFVDTSTYLIKVKSLFDRYMLSYLVSNEAPKNEESQKERLNTLIKLLSEDIKWPETYLLKSADISFAKEALETMSLLAKSMKSELKEKSD
jgi:hypothetical protein